MALLALTLTGCAKTLDSLGLSGTKGDKGASGYQGLPVVTLKGLSLAVANQTVSLNISVDQSNVSYYRVYYATDSIDFFDRTELTSAASPNVLTAVPISGTLVPGASYYIRVSAVDSNGNEGLLSNALKLTYQSFISTSSVSFDLTDITDHINGLSLGSDGQLTLAGSQEIVRFDPNDYSGTIKYFPVENHVAVVAVDDHGIVYFVDTRSDGYWDVTHTLKRFDPSDYSGTLTTLVGAEASPNLQIFCYGGNIHLIRLKIDRSGWVSLSGDDKFLRFDPNRYSETATILGGSSSSHPLVALGPMTQDSDGLIYLFSDSVLTSFDPSNYDATYKQYDLSVNRSFDVQWDNGVLFTSARGDSTTLSKFNLSSLGTAVPKFVGMDDATYIAVDVSAGKLWSASAEEGNKTVVQWNLVSPSLVVEATQP